MPMLRTAGGILAVLLPLVLLVDPHVNFTYDWHNHQWMAGYFGEYFRQHHAVPDTLNVPGAVGMPQPVFYGFLLYPLLGLIAAATGAALALRLGAALAIAIEFVAVYVGARRTIGDRWASFTLASASAWSVYGLTNLYSRSALTEFFAGAFLTSAVALGVAALAPGRNRGLLAWSAGLFFVLAFGSHPPTALIGTLFFSVMGLMIAPFRRGADDADRTVIRAVVAATVLGVLILSPWVVANLAVRGELGIVGKYQDIHVAHDRADAWAARFAPVPYDPLPFEKARHDTPYLEAPINWAVLLLAGWNVWLLLGRARAPGSMTTVRWARSLTLGASAWFVVSTVVSVSQPVADVFRVLGPYVQFATRFVGFANLGLLVIVLASGVILSARGGCGSARGRMAVVTTAFVLAAVNLGLKLHHSALIREHVRESQYAWAGDRTRLIDRGRADAAADYAAIRRRPMLRRTVVSQAATVDLPVGRASTAFGRPGEAMVRREAAGWAVTNVVAFPWNRVWIDGRDLTDAAVVANGYCDALWLPAGEHRLEWRWVPPMTWRILTALSQGLLLLMALGTIGWGVLAITRRRAPGRSPA